MCGQNLAVLMLERFRRTHATTRHWTFHGWFCGRGLQSRPRRGHGYRHGSTRIGRHDGRWRRVVVRTPERDDLQIRHKIGYFAPKPDRAGAAGGSN